MRLLERNDLGELSLTKNFVDDNIPRYAILSHTWGEDTEEITLEDMKNGTGVGKPGYGKIRFCGEQARRDGLRYFWVDTCCINKSNNTELSETINSMFSWYRNATKCYVYLADVSRPAFDANNKFNELPWAPAFQKSRWFTRGWTLQELIAPASVEFFSKEGEKLGNKIHLGRHIHEITGIPVKVLHGCPLSDFSITERLLWAEKRETTRKEDIVYSLLGIFDVYMPLIYGEGKENALRRLRETIDKASKDVGATRHGNLYWIVPHPINELFTGRTDLLLRIQKTLGNDDSSADKQKRFVITGLGGQGKSEICLKIASLMREQFWGVFWVDVSELSTAKSNFIAIAEILGRSMENIPDVLQIIANIKQTWLLILDNADDPDFDYRAYFPSGTQGAIMMTSRVSECRRYSPDASEAIESLEDGDARELLLKAADISKESWPFYAIQAEKAVHLLGSHTLALLQAGAYIARGHCNLDQYPAVYQRHRQRLLKYKPRQAQSRYCNVYATFEASAYVLERSKSEAAQDALSLLAILSMLNSSVLPLQIFEEGWNGARKVLSTSAEKTSNMDAMSRSHILQLPGFMIADSVEWDAYRLVEASSLLVSLSLATKHDMDGLPGLSMHALTHVWAKDRKELSRQSETWVTTGCILGLSRSNSNMWLTQKRRLLPHIQSYLDIKINKVLSFGPAAMIVPILLQCGWALLDMRQDFRIGRLLEDIFMELGKSPEEPSLDCLPLYDLQARSLYNLGKIRRAVELLEQVVKMQEATLALDDANRLYSQHELAIAYEANGQVKEAVDLLEQIVKIQETTLAADHPNRLASQHALAGAYEANGQIKDAVDLLEQVVKIEQTKLAADHPDRLASQHALAAAYRANGQVKEAVDLLEQIVKIQETTLAADHPDQLASQHALAIAYRANGQVKEAVDLLEQVVKIRETTLAADHPDRLASQHELAIAYKANGQIKEALDLLEQVVKIKQSKWYEGHPSRVVSEQALAYYLQLI